MNNITLVIIIAVIYGLGILWDKRSKRRQRLLRWTYSLSDGEYFSSDITVDFKKMTISFEDQCVDYPGYHREVRCLLRRTNDKLSDIYPWEYKEQDILLREGMSSQQTLTPESFYKLMLARQDEDQISSADEKDKEKERLQKQIAESEDWKKLTDPVIKTVLNTKFADLNENLKIHSLKLAAHS